MKSRLLASAFLSFRNISVLLILAGLYMLSSPYLPTFAFPFSGTVIPAGLGAVYLAFVVQSLASRDFHDQFNRKQKIRHIRNLNYMSIKLFSEAKKHTNSTYQQKLRKVVEDKNEMVESFFRGEPSMLKERIVEQALNLVVSYIRLLTNFCKRSRELSNVDVSDIANRINANNRKLSFTKDPYMAEDLKKTVGMDEKIIGRLKDEKNELERIRIKLDYMESMVNMFKHQILSSIETEEMVEKLENAVNEATALDNVLEERRRNKLRM
jgi:hypothetical protein